MIWGRKKRLLGGLEHIISLDAMGGAHAPQAIVEGAALALKKAPHLRFLIFGIEEKVLPLLSQYPDLAPRSEFIPVENVVTDDMKPTAAIRIARTSSMGLAIRALAEGRAHAVVSAGNTGAYMSLSAVMLKTIAGIHRPAITTYLPADHGRSVLLDMGANVECSEVNLAQFAIMGSVFAHDVLGISRPRVGLLNIGTEELKGTPILKKTQEILTGFPRIRYLGYVEGDDIFRGNVDVVVTDGFTGNVALKVLEGTARFVKGTLSKTLKRSIVHRMVAALSYPFLRSAFARFNPSNYNGACFLGLNGLAIKSHGSANAEAFANAILVAPQLLKHNFKEQIASGASELAEFLRSRSLAAPEGRS